MSAPQDYTVITQRFETQWNPDLQEAQDGWVVRVRDQVTGTVLPVFVPLSHYTVDGTRQMIEAALTPIRSIAQLGKPSASG